MQPADYNKPTRKFMFTRSLRRKGPGLIYLLLLLAAPWLAAEDAVIKHAEVFATTPHGRTPTEWFDAFDSRPSRAWAVDGNGFLRQLIKKQFGSYPDDFAGLLLFAGDEAKTMGCQAMADGTIKASFKKTEDAGVSFGLAARATDQNNYYLARFSGSDRLELLKMKAGGLTNIDFIQPITATDTLRMSGPRPAGLITLDRYREGEVWTLTFHLQGDILTAVLHDARGREQAKVQARDADFKSGFVGLRCTRFAAAASFQLEAKAQAGAEASLLARGRWQAADYPVVRPYWNTTELDTPRRKLASSYDVIIAGGGTGGFGAAMQAARLGARVLLLEETDWLGGQMAAGVTTMDEASDWWKYAVRERGIYREFHESMVLYYQTLDKDPLMAYYSYPHQTEGGYEPKAVRAVLYGFIKHEREHGATIDISLRSRITAVKKEGEAVRGATVEFAEAKGTSTKRIACKQLVDATEYGDVIPLTGARYRSGNTISPDLNLKSPVQDHTWLAIVREYPEGVPASLQMKSPPPGYETMKKRFVEFKEHGFQVWGAEAKGLKRPAHWRRYFAWRGLADSASPLTGARSTERHTRAGFNGGNDYPVTAATLENPAQRLLDEREGIYRSLGVLYYFQHELGLPWSLAQDEGYNTLYNQQKMQLLDLRADLRPLAVHLPQQPYVRESRRIVGLYGLSGNDLEYRDDEAKLFPTSVAMGDYGMDLDHGDTAHSIEPDLDSGELARNSGPFMVPFESFIPEKIDGFIAAEKNISQSRRASGSTRMQPITVLTGQAAGAIAALSVKQGVQPRQLNPVQVQSALLDTGSTLVPRWHVDVPFRSPIWKATQLLSLYQVMDRKGALSHDRRTLGIDNPWGVNEPLRPAELESALARLCHLSGNNLTPGKVSDAKVSLSVLRQALESLNPRWAGLAEDFRPANEKEITAGEFALVAAKCLIEGGKQ
jgi:hypothetical protein